LVKFVQLEILKGEKAMDLNEAIHARRTVRDCTNDPVDKTVLLRLIDAAIQAPSAVNEQPWSFTVISDKALLDRISIAAKVHVQKTPPKGMPAHHIQQRLSDPNYHVFYHAPALIVISSVSQGQWATENCALAAQNLMLAACAEGLGSCWIGFSQGWLGTAEGKTAIGLPADHIPVAPIIVGHPKTAPAPVPRHEPRIHWIGN
jgi:nitroreductase